MSLKILLLSPLFYGVEKEICLKLEEQGHHVIWIENKNLHLDYNGTGSKLKLLRRIYFFLFSPKVRYLKEELRKLDNIRFDILFSINGHVICKYLFRRLKHKNPQLRSILYLWDPIEMYTWKNEMIFFDKVYSFDPSDSEKLHIEYKPNFFIKKSDIYVPEVKNDLFFMGKFSSYRLLIIDQIKEQADISGLKYYLYLWPAYKIFAHSFSFYYFLRVIPYKSTWSNRFILNYEALEGLLKRDYLRMDCVNFKVMQKHLYESNVIIDLPYPGQEGYSHTLVEALANGKKLITTNKRIKDEPFYNAEQIRIIDQKNPALDFEWIRERKSYPVDNLILSMELSQWLKSIVDEEAA